MIAGDIVNFKGMKCLIIGTSISSCPRAPESIIQYTLRFLGYHKGYADVYYVNRLEGDFRGFTPITIMETE